MVPAFALVMITGVVLTAPPAPGSRGAPLQPELQPEPLSPRELRGLLDRAWRDGDDAAVYAALQRAWQDDEGTARDLCGQMLVGETTALQPVAAALLCTHASAEDLAQAARGLSPTAFPDARRMLVRALGSRDPEGAASLAAEFLEDRDLMVRAAAISACADLGDAQAVGRFIRRVQTPPAYMSSWDGGDDAILDMAMHGAVRVLTGLRPTTAGEVAAWWRGDQARVEQKRSDPTEEVLSGVSRGQRYFSTPSFDVYLRVAGLEAPTRGQPGPLDWPELTQTLEDARAAALAGAAPVFGRVHLPVIRVMICDDRQFTPHAGLSFMGGVARGNEVVLRLGRSEAIRGTMAHEMVHIVQSASYEEQPRWLSEGLASSLTRSVGGSVWSIEGVGLAGLEDWVQRGAVSESIGWTSGAASGEREGRRYALAHLVVDYLRYGGFTAPSARLTYLMGMLDRGVPSATAIEAVYGAKVRELDERLVRWLGRVQ